MDSSTHNPDPRKRSDAVKPTRKQSPHPLVRDSPFPHSSRQSLPVSELLLNNCGFCSSISGLQEYIKAASCSFEVDNSPGDNAVFFIKVKLNKLLFVNKNFDLVLRGFLLFAYAYIDYLNKEFTSPTILKLNRPSFSKFRRDNWQGKDVKPHNL